MKHLILLAMLAAGPAAAATDGPFASLKNTDFVVLVGFILFLGALVYFKVPEIITRLLDRRAAQIKADLEEARALREEARAILTSYERKQKEVQEQSDRIVANAKDEAMAAARLAKEELKLSIARRMATAEDQLASAEASAVRAVREQAVTVAIAAATELLARQMTPAAASATIDSAIDQVAAKMH
ncbi:F0F1 ATP synthase subunit B [Paracoccaceae bacterium Fryx2]|nr:F0F1 ATP synthase subunit B [Paracoccaceae bacterium Fryx2]